MDLPFEDMAKASACCFDDTCCMSIVLTIIGEPAATGGKGQNLYKFPHEASVDYITHLRNGYDYNFEQTVKVWADKKPARK